MISIELEVKLNGESVKVSQKLQDLVSWYIKQQILADSSTASFAESKIKVKPVKTYYSNVPWTDQEKATIQQRYSELRNQGVRVGKAQDIIASEMKKSPAAVRVHIYSHKIRP